MVDSSLKKRVNESSVDYERRIFNLKPLYDLTWDEVAVILNEELGYNYSSSKYRKDSYRFDEGLFNQVDTQLLEVQKEKMKIRDERTQINALIRNASREEFLKEVAIEAAQAAAAIKPLTFPKAIEKSDGNEAILCIGDWHYGLEVDTYYNKFNPAVARNRVGLLTFKVINLIEKESVTKLHVVNLGDMISGRIHLPLRINSRIDAVDQTIEVSELLCDFLNELSSHCKIEYHSVLDNHSRVEPNKEKSLNAESFARIIDWHLDTRLHDNENIEFVDNIISKDIATFNVFNHKVVAVHGDRDPQSRIISQLCGYGQEHYDLILSAHVHHFTANEDNETEFFCNGSLIGTDDYAEGLRLNSHPSQLMFISTPDNVTECIYKIKL